jgi:hypothetical protein
MCFLKDVHVFSFTRRDWFDHGSPIPTVFFFVLFGLGNHKSPTIQAHVSRLEMWCVPASLG